MFARALIVCLLLFGTGAIVERASVRAPEVPRSTLGELPFQISEWHGYDTAPLADDVVATLGVDDYVSRSTNGTAFPVGCTSATTAVSGAATRFTRRRTAFRAPAGCRLPRVASGSTTERRPST